MWTNLTARFSNAKPCELPSPYLIISAQDQIVDQTRNFASLRWAKTFEGGRQSNGLFVRTPTQDRFSSFGMAWAKQPKKAQFLRHSNRDPMVYTKMMRAELNFPLGETKNRRVHLRPQTHVTRIHINPNLLRLVLFSNWPPERGYFPALLLQRKRVEVRAHTQHIVVGGGGGVGRRRSVKRRGLAPAGGWFGGFCIIFWRACGRQFESAWPKGATMRKRLPPNQVDVPCRAAWANSRRLYAVAPPNFIFNKYWEDIPEWKFTLTGVFIEPYEFKN
jgi:hypothetical protein